MSGDDGILAAIDALRTDLIATIDTLRARMSEGFERVEDKITAMRDDMAVNFSTTSAVRTAHDHTREELRAVNELVSLMNVKLNRMDTRLRELEDRPR